jgi:hypothetical protein
LRFYCGRETALFGAAPVNLTLISTALFFLGKPRKIHNAKSQKGCPAFNPGDFHNPGF